MGVNKDLSIKSKLLMNKVYMFQNGVLDVSKDMDTRRKSMSKLVGVYMTILIPFYKGESKAFRDDFEGAIKEAEQVLCDNIDSYRYMDFVSDIVVRIKEMLKTKTINFDTERAFWRGVKKAFTVVSEE